MRFLYFAILSLTFSSCMRSTPYIYHIDLPSDYAEETAFPLLIFLHGAGEKGDDLEKVKVHGPPRLIAEGSRTFPAIVVSPLCSEDRFWMVDRLEVMLRELRELYNIDDKRMYLTGLSMGGYGTMKWAYAHPEHFAALVPICGGELQEGKSAIIKDIPLWAFHGAKDEVVPISLTEDYINALKTVGGNPRFTIYPEAGHDSWTETFENEDMWDWLFAQRK